MKKINYIKFAMLLFPVILFCKCKKTNDTISQYHLNVTSISPDNGGINTLVTIKGNNFSLILAEDTVLFNGKIASINKVSDTAIQVYAPANGSTGPVTVIVRNQQVKAQTFTYLVFAPHIISISPSAGNPLITVTITGNNFSSTPTQNVVSFGSAKATVVVADTNSLQVLVPVPSPYATGNMPVTVTVNGKASNTVQFQYNAYAPVITGIIPSSGISGTQVTVSGSNFIADTSKMQVLFNGVKAVFVSASTTRLVVMAPQSTTGTVSVTATPYGATTNGPIFTYLQPPVISSINPASGITGTQVTIKGSNFIADTSKNIVLFNGVKAPVVSASTTQIVVLAPNSSTGTVNVTTNGLTTTGPVFTYTVPVPLITDVEYNGLFLIVGNNFDPTTSIVHIGGQVVSGFTYSDYGNGQAALTKSNYTPPANLDNPAQVTVTVSNVTSSPYPYLFSPQINSVSPDTVSYQNVVTLNGILFGSRSLPSSLKAYYLDGNNTKVYLSPDPTIISWSTNTITFSMPNYGSSPIGNGAQPFYFEVNVSTKSVAAPAYFHSL